MNVTPSNPRSTNHPEIVTFSTLPGWRPGDLPPGWLDQVPVVYALHGQVGLIYVGSSVRVRKRLQAHERRTWWPFVRQVQVLDASGLDLSDFERYLIETCRPLANVAGIALPFARRGTRP